MMNIKNYSFNLTRVALCTSLLTLSIISQYSLATTLVQTSELIHSEPQKVKEKHHVRAGQARALAILAKEKNQIEQFKSVIITVEKLADNQGREYLAGLINQADIIEYLGQMKVILSDRYEKFRQHQRARDHGLFHLTLINPFEYQALVDKQQVIGRKIRVQLHGLGRVSQGSNTAYFVVASSSDGQFLRQNMLLGNKDFHVTLGFDSKDVHGVDKGKLTLITLN